MGYITHLLNNFTGDNMKALYFNYYLVGFSLYMIIVGKDSIHYPILATILIIIGGAMLTYTLKQLINDMEN